MYVIKKVKKEILYDDIQRSNNIIYIYSTQCNARRLTNKNILNIVLACWTHIMCERTLLYSKETHSGITHNSMCDTSTDTTSALHMNTARQNLRNIESIRTSVLVEF